MEELPRSSFERSDSGIESGSEKKKKNSSNVRRIGALGTYAKMSPETPPVPVDRTEARESFFKDKEDTEKKPQTESVEEKSDVIEASSEATETTAKTEALQEELTQRIEGYQEVIDSTPVDSPEHVQASAAKALDESVKEKAANPDVEADPVIEAEFARQLAEIELPEEVPDDRVENSIPESSAEENDDPDTEDDIPATPSATIPPTQTSNGAGSPPIPPTPPTRPTSSMPPLPPTGGANTFTQPNVAPNTAPVVNPNVLQDSRNERTKRRVNPAASALLGYAIGRRGGRKRTERRLEPKIAGLSQELDITKKHLEARELDLKKAANNTLSEQQAERYARRSEKVEQPKKKPVTEILRQTVMAPEKIRSAIRPAEIQIPRTEALGAPKIETAPRPQVIPETAIKRAEQLSTPALLKAAESLVIEGVSVRRMYETNKIDRNGLVAIVQEGLRGGNIVDAFEKVELGAEAQAGRAREFRHDDPSFSAISSDDPVSQPLSDLKPSPLPNNPDTGSLQPINIASQKSEPQNTESVQPDIVASTEKEKKALLDPKTAEFKFAAIAAIAIAALVVWAIFL
jgi:hypothetical protein